MTNSQDSSVIVVGAGWSGLNAARLLIERGFRVKIIEKSDRVGGRITSDYVDGFTFDRGFQVINPAYAELRETGIIPRLQFHSLPKGLELRDGLRTIRVGDFRSNLSYLRGDLDKEIGTLREKLALLGYLRGKSRDVALEEALSKSGDFYRKVLKPFLDGVFLTDSNKVPNRVARELIHWFVKGRPGVPVGGVRKASELLAEGLDIEFNTEVLEVAAKRVVTTREKIKADSVLLATDPISAARLLGLPEPKMSASRSWYFNLPAGEISSSHLRIGGIGPVTNSVVISNLAPSYAPRDRSLLVATTLSPCTESEVREHLSYLWESDSSTWELLRDYSIPHSLPYHALGQPLVSQASNERGIYLAGDWRATPSQQGALLSGRLAARAIISDR